MMAVPFLLVSASNTGKIWTVRTMGEHEYVRFVQALAARSRLSYALTPMYASCAFVALVGFMLCILSPESQDRWGWWVGAGIVGYAGIVAFHSTFALRRLFRAARGN